MDDKGLSLASSARASRRFYGAAVQLAQLQADAGYRNAVLDQCDSLTPELALKWAALQPTPSAPATGVMDQLADFARANNKRLHGHTLLWHRSVPAWAHAALTANKPDWGLVHGYFGAVVTRYGDVIDAWDVVNEPIEPKDNSHGLRRSVFLDAFGPDYVRLALQSARSFAPRAQLMINEYGLEYPHGEDAARRKSLLALIDSLLRQNAPLDGVGIQAHFDLDKGSINQGIVQQFLKELADRRLTVLITELDVREPPSTLTVEARDQKVADTVRRFLDVALDQPAVRGVTTWGLSDRYSWLNAEGGAPANPGGNRGLPYDSTISPKPLYYAMTDALRSGRVASPFRQPAPMPARRDKSPEPAQASGQA